MVNGSSGGPYYLYATGITTTTYTAATAVGTNSYAATTPPTVNTTPFTYLDANNNTLNFVESNIRAGEWGNLQDVYRNAGAAIDDWLRGDPQTYAGIIAKLRHAHAAIAAIAQAFADIGTLVDANAGTIKPVATGIGAMQQQRSWP